MKYHFFINSLDIFTELVYSFFNMLSIPVGNSYSFTPVFCHSTYTTSHDLEVFILNKQPIYLQLADYIQGKIDINEYTFGSKIPSEREFCNNFQISRMTVRKAIDHLIEKGYLVRFQGKGTFVNKQKLDSPLDTIQSMKRFIHNSGLVPSNRVIHTEKKKAGLKYSKIFHINPEDDIFCLFRLRLGDDKPIAMEYTYIPYNLIPDIDSYNFEHCSLYALFEHFHVELYEDYQTLEIVKIFNPQSALLKVPEGSPVFMLHNTVVDTSGRIVEYTRSYMSKNAVTFTSILT